MPIKRTGKEGNTCVICAVVKLVTGVSYEISLINFLFRQLVLLFLGFGCENYPVEYSFKETGRKDGTTNSVTIFDRNMLRRKKTKDLKKVICTECKTLPKLEPCQHQPVMVLENKDEVRNVLEKRNDVISKLESAEATLVKKKAEASKKTLNPASNKKNLSLTKPRKEITYHQEPVSANMFARGDIIWAQEWTFIEPVKHSADDMPKVQEDLKTFGSGELGQSASKSTAFLHLQEQLVNGEANITNIKSSGNVATVQDKTSNGVWSKPEKGATVRPEPAEGQLVRFSPGLQTRPLSNGIGLVAYIQPEGPFEQVRYGINEFVNFLKLSHLRVNQPPDANHRRFLKNTVGLVNSWLTSKRMLTSPVESEMPWLGVLVQLRHDYKKYQSGTSAERQTYLSLQNTLQNFRNWLDAFPSHRPPDLNPAPAYTVPNVPDAIKGYTGDQAKTSKQKASRLPRPVNALAEKEHSPALQNGKSSATAQNKASTSPASATNNVSTKSKWWPFKSKGTTKAAKDAGTTTVTTQKKTMPQDSLKPDSAAETDPSVFQSKTSRDVEKAPVETSSSWNKVKNIVRAKTRNEGPEHLPEKSEIHREPSKIGEYLRRKLRPTRRLAAAAAPPNNDREMKELIEKVNEMVIQEKQLGAAAQELKANQSPVITNKMSENCQRPTQPRLNATPTGQPEIIGASRNPPQTITATASDQGRVDTITATASDQGRVDTITATASDQGRVDTTDTRSVLPNVPITVRSRNPAFITPRLEIRHLHGQFKASTNPPFIIKNGTHTVTAIAPQQNIATSPEEESASGSTTHAQDAAQAIPSQPQATAAPGNQPNQRVESTRRPLAYFAYKYNLTDEQLATIETMTREYLTKHFARLLMYIERPSSENLKEEDYHAKRAKYNEALTRHISEKCEKDIEAISKSQGKQLEKVLSKILEKPPTSAETSSAATPLDGQALSTATNHPQLSSVATPTGGVTTDEQANQQCSCDHCLGLDHVCGAENKAAANEDAKPAAAPQSSSTPKKKHRRNKRKGRNLKWKTSSPSVAPSSAEDAQNETFGANHGVEDPLNDSIDCSTADTTLNDTLNSTLNTTANDTDAENQDTMKMANTDKETNDTEKDVPAKGNTNPAEAVVTSVVEKSFHEYLVTENRVNYSDMSIMPGHADRVNKKKMANNVKVKVKTKGTPNKHLDKDLKSFNNKQWNASEGFSNAEDDGGNNEGEMVIDVVEGENAESVDELRSVKVADVVVPDFDEVVLDNRGYNMVPEEIIRKEGSNRLKELEDLYAVSSPEKGDKRGRQKKKKNNKKGWTLALTNPHNMR